MRRSKSIVLADFFISLSAANPLALVQSLDELQKDAMMEV